MSYDNIQNTVRRLPPADWHKVKLHALLKRKTAHDLLTEIVRAWLEAHEVEITGGGTGMADYWPKP